MKIINLTGKRFGKWVVLSRVYCRSKNVKWLCRCDCGIEKEVDGNNLRDSKSLRCRNCLFLISGESLFRDSLRTYKKGAERRGLVWDLLEKDVRNLFDSSCYYCGAKPEKRYVPRQLRKGNFLRNGIDRKNNDVGYIPDNCISCCTRCNRMKLNMTYSVFISHIKKILEHLRLE
jgi:hypothetical protein